MRGSLNLIGARTSFSPVVKFGMAMMFLMALSMAVAPFVVLAAGEEAVVADFADWMLDIMQGPVARILAAVILFAAVINLFRGKQAAALGCAVAFLVLVFLPKLIQGFGK